jgi:hypothetical protein
LVSAFVVDDVDGSKVQATPLNGSLRLGENISGHGIFDTIADEDEPVLVAADVPSGGSALWVTNLALDVNDTTEGEVDAIFHLLRYVHSVQRKSLHVKGASMIFSIKNHNSLAAVSVQDSTANDLLPLGVPLSSRTTIVSPFRDTNVGPLAKLKEPFLVRNSRHTLAWIQDVGPSHSFWEVTAGPPVDDVLVGVPNVARALVTNAPDAQGLGEFSGTFGVRVMGE